MIKAHLFLQNLVPRRTNTLTCRGQEHSKSMMQNRFVSGHRGRQIAALSKSHLGRTPNTAGTFRKKFRKDPGNALRAFPGIPLESSSGIPQALSFKASEGSRALPEFSPPPSTAGDAFFFQKWFRRGPSEPVMEFPAVLGVYF